LARGVLQAIVLAAARRGPARHRRHHAGEWIASSERTVAGSSEAARVITLLLIGTRITVSSSAARGAQRVVAFAHRRRLSHRTGELDAGQGRSSQTARHPSVEIIA
jgi:hypothetical protein